jgi:hypothetical protein
VQALISFYSQVDQMNRGLDAVERYRAANDEGNMKKEVGRLIGKAQEMQHPEAIRERGQGLDFYAGAIAAVNRHRPKHQDRRSTSALDGNELTVACMNLTAEKRTQASGGLGLTQATQRVESLLQPMV